MDIMYMNAGDLIWAHNPGNEMSVEVFLVADFTRLNSNVLLFYWNVFRDETKKNSVKIAKLKGW